MTLGRVGDRGSVRWCGLVYEGGLFIYNGDWWGGDSIFWGVSKNALGWKIIVRQMAY